MSSLSDIAKTYVDSFHRAISLEMDAMRQQLGPFEVPLGDGQVVDENEAEKVNLYEFKVPVPNDKLVLHGECTLRYETGEQLVRIAKIEKDTLTLSCEYPIRLNSSSYTLVIYPWFLYEKLKNVLTDLLSSRTAYLESALRTFGKIPPSKQEIPVELSHVNLNESQQQAIALCCESNLAFVWGPPGTGKTTTLGHIVTELLNKDYRILVTSTTNAAVDQALTQLKSLQMAQEFFKCGQVVRVGQTSEDTCGAGLYEVLHRLNADIQHQLQQLKSRLPEVFKQIRQCELLIDKLGAADRATQLSLFEPVKSVTITEFDLLPLFSRYRIDRILTFPVREQKALVIHRQKRLNKLRALYEDKIATLTRKLQHKERDVVSNAKLVLATMTNVYISQLLIDQQFDVVIIEEAGMAILPTLFYCTALAKDKVIFVGDPKQLPPIVQSRDPYAHQAMGRSIFDIRVPDPHNADIVVMLNIQYRMHPVIGDLVNRLFYDGKLENDPSTIQRHNIAERNPFADKALVVIDTEDQTRCTTQQGSFSRMNLKTAEHCSKLAKIAIESGQQSVAIIAPYAEQSRLIGRLLIQNGIDLTRVVCRTVHRFQGNERDMVILDTVDTAPLKPGVLLSDTSTRSSSQNLINVSLSRARGKLIIIADVAYFNARAPEGSITRVLNQALETGIRIPWGKID